MIGFYIGICIIGLLILKVEVNTNKNMRALRNDFLKAFMLESEMKPETKEKVMKRRFKRTKKPTDRAKNWIIEHEANSRR